MKLNWNPDATPQALNSALRLLAEEYPLREVRGSGSANLTFASGSETMCGIRHVDSEICIVGGSTAAQLRAVGSALSGLPGHGASIKESCPFSTISIMLDCSRNAVMNVAHVKQWLRRLALLGYNQVMLYAEDTYEIPGEPRFGYLKACELTENCSAALIWDDPIIGIFLNEGFPPKDWPSLTEIQQRFARLAKELAGYSGQNSAGDIDHARLLADVLSRKIGLRVRLVDGYDSRDHAALMAVGKDALALAESFETLEASWRRGWMRRNKPQGYEVIQLRLAQQAIRHRELARRIDELLKGAVAAIPELDERMREAKGMGGGWRFLASGSVSI